MYPIKTDNANITSSDVMCEIGNIACGHLITSLSNFACADFRITVPDMEFVGYDALPDRLGDMEQLTVSVLLELQGDIEGLFVFLAEPEFASAILEKIGAGPMCAETFGEDAMRDSALAELGNIMCSAYVDALCEFTGLKEKISVSQVRKKQFIKIINWKEYKCYSIFYPVGNGRFNIDKSIEDILWIRENFSL